MSFINTAIDELDKSSEIAAKEVKSSLEMLEKLAQAKKDEMLRFTDDRIKRAVENQEIPAGLKMFEASEVRVVSSKGPSEGIKSALDLFLQDAENRWKEGVSKLINSALDTLLGSAEGASQNVAYYLIALDGHAKDEEKQSEETYVPVRIDYSLWVYNFKKEGLKDTVESALAYHARKSLLDYSKIPSRIQIEQSLKNIGTPKELRNEIIEMIESERKNGQPKNVVSYGRRLPLKMQKELSQTFKTSF